RSGYERTSNMEMIRNDKRVIGNMIIDTLIGIKDSHRDVLTSTEVDDLNRAANFIEDVIREIKE
ncbi:MAG: hypothetical protein IIY21_15515, partial [Clostridiales bacterium]|nr:hypothetical protein [Clostridiales bacterium]